MQLLTWGISVITVLKCFNAGKCVAVRPFCKVYWSHLVLRFNFSEFQVIFIILVYTHKCIGGEKCTRHSSKLLSNVQMYSLYGKCAVIAQLKTALSVSSPSIFSFFQSPFQPQPKNKQFPSIILHPNYISPAAPFYWLELPNLGTLRHSKENSPTERCARGRLTWYAPACCYDYTVCLPEPA